MDKSAPEADPICPRCMCRMEPVATIEPFADQPGLVAHVCPDCGHASSRLIGEKAAGERS
jgi:hypothetical protein